MTFLPQPRYIHPPFEIWERHCSLSGQWILRFVDGESDSYIRRLHLLFLIWTVHYPPKLENLTKINGLLLIGGRNLLRLKEESIKQKVSPYFGHSQLTFAFFYWLICFTFWKTDSVYDVLFLEGERVWNCCFVGFCLIHLIICYAIILSYCNIIKIK
jgi:hypothetical protein